MITLAFMERAILHDWHMKSGHRPEPAALAQARVGSAPSNEGVQIMATRRDTTRTHEQSDPATVSDTELRPALREYRTSDLKPSTPPGHAQALRALVDRLGEIEDMLGSAGRTLQ